MYFISGSTIPFKRCFSEKVFWSKRKLLNEQILTVFLRYFSSILRRGIMALYCIEDIFWYLLQSNSTIDIHVHSGLYLLRKLQIESIKLHHTLISSIKKYQLGLEERNIILFSRHHSHNIDSAFQEHAILFVKSQKSILNSKYKKL